MQQTKKYRFNLIESSDPFSAQPLNDNMEKMEGALDAADTAVKAAAKAADTAVSAHRTEVNAALSAQAAKVAALPRIVTGSYTGTGTYGEDHPTVLEFPDAERPPTLILVCDLHNDYEAVMIRGMKKCLVFWDTYTKYYINLTWTDKGVRCYSTRGDDHQFNNPNTQYFYAAFI